ncbi:MAG TPA: hypothetical protein VF434_15840 [Promineifilum sp.]
MPDFRAAKVWQFNNPDPFHGPPGERLTLGRRDDACPGWVGPWPPAAAPAGFLWIA